MLPYNMQYKDNGLNLNERVRCIKSAMLEIQLTSIRLLRLLDMAQMMEDSVPDGCSTDGIYFDRPEAAKWPNEVFQRHMDRLLSDLIEMGRLAFGPRREPPFFLVRPIESRFWERKDSRDSSASSRSRHQGSTSHENKTRGSLTPQNSVVSSVVMV